MEKSDQQFEKVSTNDLSMTNTPSLNANSSKNTTNEKLISNYNKLKLKYENKVKENKTLKGNLDGAIEAIKIFEESYKSIQSIYVQVKDSVSNLKLQSCNNDFSTTDVSQINRQLSICKVAESPLIIPTGSSSNIFLLKKLEDFEMHYQEMNKNFNSMVMKYKMLKDEKIKIEESSLKILNRYSQLEKQYDETIRELYCRYDEIKRIKEIDKCLIDYTFNSFILKIDARDVNNKTKNDSIIKCEPIPTIAKFLVNKK